MAFRPIPQSTMFKVAVGHSNDPDSQFAIEEAIHQCLQTLGDDRPQAGVLFAAITFDHSLILHHIHAALPGLALIGSTTNGEVSSILQFQQDSLTLMLFSSDQVEIYAGLGRNLAQDPLQAAQSAIKMAQAQTQSSQVPRLCLTFPESLTASGVVLLEALQQSLGITVPIVGGMAADDYTFEATYQFYQTEVLRDSVPVLLFFGDLQVASGVASGWTPLGKPSRVTKVQGNIVYEIDGQRAVDYYQHYLGANTFASEYAIYALAIFEPDGQQFYMRAPNGYDEEVGSVTFFSDIPDQAIVQITEVSRENILAASEVSFQQALANYPGTEPDAALLISCSARRRILGTRANEEYQRIQAHLPRQLPSCGFYAYGELSPLEPNGISRFHNKTFVTLLLGTR